ncbi:hypothetical protein N7537_001340 [Penicillium hordei]|uniref:Uncharacterized protein n=1 Tax=Penicillium hordei TaxID=40994 RepID=A0AAD6EFA6_9EURO|nr:uncharacterized protein N7537_001340 [Penicillium hordei]KAJ5616226.1 hypothetical protein N7537_001340 [Penicillium hordei]
MSRSLSPPFPIVEDDLDDVVLALANLPLDLSNPLILEYRVLETEPLPDPDTFDYPLLDDDVEIAGSLGVLERYLSINVYYGKNDDSENDNSVIYLSQFDYVDKILARFGLENCKLVAIPMDEKQPLIERLTLEGTALKAEIKEF